MQSQRLPVSVSVVQPHYVTDQRIGPLRSTSALPRPQYCHDHEEDAAQRLAVACDLRGTNLLVARNRTPPSAGGCVVPRLFSFLSC
eukprot:745162-Pelagomonas_calceolata.AAC.1